MYSLLLKFKAPLQAWGAESRFKVRHTNNEPTKSGVIGLLSAALGRDRQEPVDDLAQLEFAVRVDHPGQLTRDYHTARNWFGKDKNSQLSTRYYLADAVFLVALASPQKALLEELEAALRRPVYPLYLGRRACPANPDLVLGIREGNAEEVLRAENTWYAPKWAQQNAGELVSLAILRDARLGEPADTLRDIPVSFNPEFRQYSLRSVFRAEPLEINNPEGETEPEDEFMKVVTEA
ncbi:MULTISPECIES: type I-E CRISPR-associated protein Cas5/CasD [Rothia]|uniref:type I-E CRISPR-associated protein Cas5/CasD n=1 Tax=Rothia TaxID=32207 RepID=UPI001627B654|nr:MULTISPECIES: type I-E CRISPR-associated protein Cas5/CasD [Rothia]WHS49676.1 type I-E CRISPR-associated protein Cas5/CasD [Rothia sp. SD9660Na]